MTLEETQFWFVVTCCVCGVAFLGRLYQVIRGRVMKKPIGDYLRKHEYAKTQGMSLDEIEIEEKVKAAILNRRWLEK